MTAGSAYLKSCYKNFNWQISEDSTCETLIKTMVAQKVGALAVTKLNNDGKEEVYGIVSERDVMSKLTFMGKDASVTTVKEIAVTGRSNLIHVSTAQSIDTCMEKILSREIRHLLIRSSTSNQESEFIGLISIKDIVKCMLEKMRGQQNKLEDMVMLRAITND
jgi:CBS domain-containing protein